MSSNVASIVLSLPPVNQQAGGQSHQAPSDSQNNTAQGVTASDILGNGNSQSNNTPDTGSHFSKLLNAAHDNNSQPQQTTSKSSQSQQQQSQSQKSGSDNNTNNTNNAANSSNNNNKLNARTTSNDTTATSSDATTAQASAPADNSNADDSMLNDIAQIILLAQSTGSGQAVTQDDSGTDTTAGLSAQDQNLLQQLQQLLQELLQKAAAFGQGSQTSDSTATDTTQNDTSTAPQQGTNNDLSKDSDVLAQMLSQLLALLQQLSQQPDAQALSAELNNMTVTPDGQTAANVLMELAQSLQKQVGGDTATAVATTDTTTDNNASGIAIPQQASDAVNPFDKMIGKLMDVTKNNTGKPDNNTSTPQAKAPIAANTAASDAINATNTSSGDSNNQTQMDKLQNTLSNIMQALSSVEDAKQAGPGQSSDSQDHDASADTANALFAASQTPHTVNHNTAPAMDTVKFSQTQQPATPVSEQVLVQIRNAAEGSSLIKIQLEPADLGKVEVQMSTTADGKTSISITADNRQTMAMLQNEARSLESALRNIGIKTDSGGLNFSLNQQQSGNNTNGNNSGGYTKVAGIGGVDEDAEFGTINASYQLTVKTGLDIRV